MKVLHIVKTAVGAKWVYEQARVLRSQGIEITVALPDATRGMAPKYRAIGASVHEADLDFPARQAWKLPDLLTACRRIVAEISPDVIHTHHVGTTLVVRLALGRRSTIPRVFQVPGPLHLEHKLFARLETGLAGDCDHWIAGCQWTLQKYRRLGVREDRLSLSYPGTDVSAFGSRPRGKLRRELGIPPQTPLIGMIAYMYAPKRFLGQRTGLKGHEDFLHALRLVRESRPDVHAIIVGGAWAGATWYEDRVKKLGTRLNGGAVIFLGTRDDVPELYPDLDVAVVPSHSENAGGALEALLSGVPVVATNVGGLPELVQPPATGYLCPPHEPRLLARTILEALSDRKEALQRSSRGQGLARGLFDVERTGRAVAGLYERILTRHACSVDARVAQSGVKTGTAGIGISTRRAYFR